MPGETAQTPLISIRLLGQSMRSQAVSTLLMRSPESPSMPLAARRTFFSTLRAASSASAPGGVWSNGAGAGAGALRDVVAAGRDAVREAVREVVRVTMVMGFLGRNEKCARAQAPG